MNLYSVERKVWLVGNKLKRMRNGRSWPNLRQYPGTCLQRQRQLSQDPDHRAEIWAPDLSNKKQRRCPLDRGFSRGSNWSRSITSIFINVWDLWFSRRSCPHKHFYYLHGVTSTKAVISTWIRFTDHSRLWNSAFHTGPWRLKPGTAEQK
jgi:hypothetical protein